ncbi:transcript variant X2 [Nothobranchius furzeri]|uniref:N-acetyl-alpha-glucosaminidase n=1 Tax=Nothobranchius furzeri TaxID=105023 RepID=A0A8C6LYX4_NOTFU|nr:transcript variant X2 [Nothobranchius furzeri]
MPLSRHLPLLALCLFVTADCRFPTLEHIRTSASEEAQSRAVAGLLRRLLGNRSSEFVVSVNRSLSNDSLDVCELSSSKNKILATGSSGVAVASGIYNYLKYFCNCHVSWCGRQLELPSPLPRLTGVLRINTPHRFRYYQNVCTVSYSFVWWDWHRWEEEIDWMALNGINLPLAFTGQEALWQEVYRALGLNESEIEEFFSGPAFLAWNRMANMKKFGGPLPQSWHVNQLVLQVVSTSQRYHSGTMGSFQLQLLLLLHPRPTRSTLSPDWLPLSGSSDPAYLAAISRSVFASMTAVDPDAVWLMQGWLFYSDPSFWKPAQIQALLHGVPLGRMIVLDLFAETDPVFSYTESFYGQPFIWCMLHNFGGNHGFYGTVESINSGPFKALTFPNSTMVGVGMTPEGIEQNPVIYELMSELAWRKEPVNLAKWVSLYAARRYGSMQDNLTAAWKLLFASVYNCTVPNYINHNHSPLVRRPSFRMNTGLWYDPADLVEAWKLFMEAAPSLMSKETFQYDLVDVTRQVLQVLTTHFYLDIVNAFQSKKMSELMIAGGVLIYDLLPELNRLLSSNQRFLLGSWLEQAQSMALNEKEAQLYDMNARNQVTLWGPSGEILDYANKQWGGLIEDYYAQRWVLFVQTLVESLDSGVPFNQDTFNQAVFQIEKGFIYNGRKYPTKPQGDTYEIAHRIFLKYYPQAIKKLH